MCKVVSKAIGKVFGIGGSSGSMKVSPTAAPLEPPTIGTNQAATEADRLALLFGASGLGTLTNQKKRGRAFAAGTSTDVATLGVRLGS